LVIRRVERNEKKYDDMTYLGRWFIGCCVWRWDMVGIAHGEEGVNRAILVAAHRVDNRMPTRKKALVVNMKWMAKPSVSFEAHRMAAS
jgi:hypothetical protein